MADQPPTDHDEIQDALVRIESHVGAAEVHGALCGRLCAPSARDDSVWLQEFLGDVETQGRAYEHCRDALLACSAHAERQLASPSFGFDLLLPDDDELLRRRSDALASWCGGFLYGLGLGGAAVASGLGEQAREVLEDFSEFTRMQAEPGGGDAEERAFMELVEYVRMGVLLVREELLGPGPATGVPTRH